MILVDANILIYAKDRSPSRHIVARGWWEKELAANTQVSLSWVGVLGFLRITTNAKAVLQPLTMAEAVGVVEWWFACPSVTVLQPTPLHWTVFRRFLEVRGARSNLTTDAHLAALAVEHDCELVSADADFAQFPGLRWRNPLESRQPTAP